MGKRGYNRKGRAHPRAIRMTNYKRFKMRKNNKILIILYFYSTCFFNFLDSPNAAGSDQQS